MLRGLKDVLRLVITPICLSFFYEFSNIIYKPTSASLNEATFGVKGKYIYPVIFTGVNFLLQIYTTPIWTSIAQRDNVGRRNAIVASLMASLFPQLVALIAIAVNSEDTIMVYKAYIFANAFGGIFGLPIALAFAIAKFDRHTLKQIQDAEEGGGKKVGIINAEDDKGASKIDPLFIVMLSVPAGVLVGNALSRDTPRIGYATVLAIGATVVSAAIMFIDNRYNYSRRQALSAAEVAEVGFRDPATPNAIHLRDTDCASSGDVTTASRSQGHGLLKYIQNRKFMALALPLALLQFGHEAFFALTGTHIFGLLKEKLGPPATKAFIGTLFSTGAGCNMMALLILPWLLHRYFNIGHIGLALLGISSASISYLFYGIGKTEALLWVAELSGFCVLLAKPALASALVATGAASVDEEGEITGAFFAMGHIGSIVGIIVGAVIFTAIGQDSYFVLMVAPVLALGVLIISFPNGLGEMNTAK